MNISDAVARQGQLSFALPRDMIGKAILDTLAGLICMHGCGTRLANADNMNIKSLASPAPLVG